MTEYTRAGTFICFISIYSHDPPSQGGLDIIIPIVQMCLSGVKYVCCPWSHSCQVPTWGLNSCPHFKSWALSSTSHTVDENTTHTHAHTQTHTTTTYLGKRPPRNHYKRHWTFGDCNTNFADLYSVSSVITKSTKHGISARALEYKPVPDL